MGGIVSAKSASSVAVIGVYKLFLDSVTLLRFHL
jgi:hypothetical protein